LRHVESAKQAATSALNGPSGRVSIGLPTAFAPLLSYKLFMRVRDAFPQILLHVADSNSALLHERLLNGRVDIALLFTNQPERGIAVESLLMEELFYVTADPDTSPITLADAAQRPLLVSGPNSSSRRIVQRIFDERGLSATWIGEIDTVSALRCAIASGVGNSILPSCNVYDDQQKPVLNLRRLADAELVRPVALCFSEVGQHSPAIDAVALTLKSLVRELVESGTWQGVSLVDDPAELSAPLVPP
jgi:LysR family transcriptional regulator, nitrogen assimilation regulatory protein